MPKKKITTKPAATVPAATVEPTDDALALPPAAQIVLALLEAEKGTTAAELSDRTGLARSTVTKSLGTLLDKGLATRQEGGHDGPRRIADRWFAAPGAVPAPVAGDDAPQPIETRPDADGSSTPAAETVDGDAENALDGEAADQEESGDGAEATAAVPAEAPGPVTVPAAESNGTAHGPEDAASTGSEPDGEEAGDASAEEAPTGAATAADDISPNEAEDGAAESDAESAPVASEDQDAAPRLGKGELRSMVEAHLRENPDREWTPTAISKVLGRSAGAINNACVKLAEAGTVKTFPDKPIRFQWDDEAVVDAA